MRIEPGTPCTSMSESISKSESNTHLSCYICDRSRCDSCHTVDTGVTRTCCLVLIFDQAWGCENILEALEIGGGLDIKSGVT